MKCLLPVALMLSFAGCAHTPAEEKVDLRPFVVDAATAQHAYTPPGPEAQLASLREEYQLPPLSSEESKDTVRFYIFICPYLGGSPFCVSGRLEQSEHRLAGELSLHDRGEEKRYVLSLQQAATVFAWFQDSKFLDPKTPSVVPASVLDGVGVFVESMKSGQHHIVCRNAYDSAASRIFYEAVLAFKVWKTEANQTPHPTPL